MECLSNGGFRDKWTIVNKRSSRKLRSVRDFGKSGDKCRVGKRRNEWDGGCVRSIRKCGRKR